MHHPYKTITYSSANENGREQIDIERARTVAEVAFAALSGDFDLTTTVTKSYVADGLRWVEKETGLPADGDLQFELFEIKGRMKRVNREMENEFR